MNLLKIIEFLRVRLKTVVYAGLGALALLVLWDAVLVHKEHAHTFAEKKIPGFWSVFGFVACVMIILVSKWFGHCGIMKQENYYDARKEDQSDE